MRRGLGLVVALLTISMAAPALATADAGQTWPSFNESDGCEQPAGFHGPLASQTGPLANSEPIYGPFGDAFGRTVGAIRNRAVDWKFPTQVTGGAAVTVRVHERALPAFQRAAANLIAGAAANPSEPYAVKLGQTGGMYARTIGGRLSISMHTFGTTVDINWRSNPYSADNVLITDMPAWFVQAWRDAGFCWGGDWIDIKDPMHFSWKGAAATAGYGQWPLDYPVLSAAANFTSITSFDTPWHLDHTASFVLSEANRDGASDAYRLRPWGGGTLIEFARTSTAMNACAVGRYWSPEDFDPDDLILADRDGDARNDLWWIDRAADPIELRVWTRADDYESSTTFTTGIMRADADAKFTSGDVDRDGAVDLLVLLPGPTTFVEAWSGATNFTTTLLTAGMPVDTASTSWWPTMGDRDLDGFPDLAILTGAGTSPILHIAPRSSNYGTVTEARVISTPAPIETAQLGSLDGDGRTDLFVQGTDGSVTGYLGGNLGVADVTRWFRDPAWTCPDDESIDLFPEIEAHLPRYQGANRFETSALLSSRFIAKPVEEVFVASGRNFPDALTAGPLAAAFGAPVLLVEPDSLPPSIAAELDRLDPVRVTIVGGPAAIADSVVEAVRSLTGAEVRRVSGENRYATAGAMAALFDEPDTVYIATGLDFPDALTATPVAHLDGAPILLVRRDDIPPSTLRALTDLAPSRIRVLGGTAVISDAVVAQLEALVPDTTRIAGANRFATATQLAARMPGGTEAMVVYGRNFADAVSAGAIAAGRGMPMLLVDDRSVTLPTALTLLDRGVTVVHVVGGPAAVSNTVWGELIEYVRSE